MTQSITDIKFEHGHDANRLADSVAQLRELCAEKDATIKGAQGRIDELLAEGGELRDKLALEKADRQNAYKTIDEQEREIANFSETQNEAKLLLAALQHKYTEKVEELARNVTAQLDAERKHSAYVEQMEAYRLHAEKKLASLERSVSYMNSIIAENTELAISMNNRIIWRKVKILATERVKRIFARRNQLESV